jgi:hypothetical protein
MLGWNWVLGNGPEASGRRSEFRRQERGDAVGSASLRFWESRSRKRKSKRSKSRDCCERAAALLYAISRQYVLIRSAASALSNFGQQEACFLLPRRPPSPPGLPQPQPRITAHPQNTQCLRSPTDLTEPTPVPWSPHAPCTPHFPAQKNQYHAFPNPASARPPHGHPRLSSSILLILPGAYFCQAPNPAHPAHPANPPPPLPPSFPACLSCALLPPPTSHPNLAFGYSLLKHPLPHVCIISLPLHFHMPCRSPRADRRNHVHLHAHAHAHAHASRALPSPCHRPAVVPTTRLPLLAILPSALHRTPLGQCTTVLVSLCQFSIRTT